MFGWSKAIICNIKRSYFNLGIPVGRFLNDIEVKKIQEYIKTNYQDKIIVEDMADMVGVSRRSFESTRKNITEVM